MNQRSEEWNKRISIWVDELQKHFYTELKTVKLEGYVTKRKLTYEEAMKQSYLPMPPGTDWGAKWEYGWFRANIVLPEVAQGQAVCFVPKTGGESLAWVNGSITCAVDLQHYDVKLTDSATPGVSYTVVLESYAGHGPRLENGGPYPPERIAVPEPPKHQVTVGTSSIGIWNKDAYDLAMDVMTLYKLWQVLDPKSLRFAKIKEGLQDFTKIVDYELPFKERNASFRKARQILQPLLSCVNGSTMPEFTIFGQSHLDLAWKWPWEETRRKCGRTYSTQLALSDEYPDYKFLVCEPIILESIKKDYPELLTRIKQKVSLGQFLPEGGVWVEPDTNIPSGESLIRQCVWGKQWFWNEFGYDTKMVWLPDCFGFSGQLPQIMIGTGMKYFATQKIARASKGHDVFPYNIFWWEGIDGTRILTHFYNKNNSRYDPQLLVDRWNKDRVQQENIETFLFPFGFGDGGGGPTREMLEIVDRTKDLEGVPRTVMQSPVAFFEEIEKTKNIKNRYIGEIYLAWHRGTYTVQAKIKQGNRRAEIALRDLEFWGSLAQLHCKIIGAKMEDASANKESDNRYPRKELYDLWEKLLFNQFHDIIAGTSITRVHREAERDFESIINGAHQLCEHALVKMISSYSKSDSKINGITVFNSLSWERPVLVKLPDTMTGATNGKNERLPSQKIGESYFVEVDTPPCGYTAIYPFNREGCENDNARVVFTEDKVTECETGSKLVKIHEAINASPKIYEMENELLRIQVNECGEIISIYDKEASVEYASGRCNHFRMYQDINVDYDAWELSNFYEEIPVELNHNAAVEVITHGELLGTIRIRKKLNNSELLQDITLYAGSRRVDFITRIDWQETHKLLKVEFPVQIFAEEALEEIQFGYVKRPTHKSRQFDADRFEVCNHRYTALSEPSRCFAVLNDSNYGVSTDRNKIALSLLRAPLIPDMYADKGMHEFTYAFYAVPCSFSESEIIQQGYALNIPAVLQNGILEEKSFFELSNPGIILETVKMADDGSQDIILRLYEAKKCLKWGAPHFRHYGEYRKMVSDRLSLSI